MNGPNRKLEQCDPGSVRFGQRRALEAPVGLAVDGRPLGRGMIRNASISGALIETALDLPLHTNLLVILTIPDGNARSLRGLSACVVRVDVDGVGVEWRDMGSVDITDLLARASKGG
jgi:hypothetical protein